MVANRHEIVDILQQHQDEIRALGVRRLALFGSFARGEGRSDSDVDIVFGA